jgi:TolB protein
VTRFARELSICALVVSLAGAPASAAPPPARRLTQSGHFKQRPCWSPDGKKLLFSQHRGTKIGIVLFTTETATETLLAAPIPQYDACWSPDGMRLAYTRVGQTPGQGNLDVYISKADGTDAASFAGDEGKLSHEEYAAWSPDGRRIAYSSTSEGNQEIFAADVDGKNRIRITSDPAIDAHPAWSPDSRRLVFATSRWGDFEIALVDADGRNLVRLTSSPRLDEYPVFSPDGKRIAFVSNRDGNYEIYVLNLGDPGAVLTSAVNATMHPALDSHPAWTPDGNLTFVSNRDDGFDLYVMP